MTTQLRAEEEDKNEDREENSEVSQEDGVLHYTSNIVTFRQQQWIKYKMPKKQITPTLNHLSLTQHLLSFPHNQEDQDRDKTEEENEGQR